MFSIYDRRSDLLAAAIFTTRAKINRNVIISIKETMDKLYARFYDKATGDHLMESTISSGPKTEAVQEYIGGLTKLILESKGVELKGISSASLCSENAYFINTSNRIIVSRIESGDQLFDLCMRNLYGYDDQLLRYASTGKLVDLMNYINAKFNFDVEYDGDRVYLISFFKGLNKEVIEYFNGEGFDECMKTLITNCMSLTEDQSNVEFNALVYKAIKTTYDNQQ